MARPLWKECVCVCMCLCVCAQLGCVGAAYVAAPLTKIVPRLILLFYLILHQTISSRGSLLKYCFVEITM